MKTLTIKLTAPLQSYGNEATFSRRTTHSYPTKSAVIGMIGAALGYRRDDTRIQTLNKLSVAVRVDQPGKVMTDFQIVEYAKNANKTARKLTYRDYLQDAIFLVGIGSDNHQLIDQIKFALKHPKFQLYLGRRSNPPAGPLDVELFSNANPIAVLKKKTWQAADWFKKRYRDSTFNAEIISDANLIRENNLHSIFQLKDSVGSFSQKNRYHDYREIVSFYIPVKNDFYSGPATEQDPMALL